MKRHVMRTSFAMYLYVFIFSHLKRTKYVRINRGFLSLILYQQLVVVFLSPRHDLEEKKQPFNENFHLKENRYFLKRSFLL